MITIQINEINTTFGKSTKNNTNIMKAVNKNKDDIKENINKITKIKNKYDRKTEVRKPKKMRM